MSSTNAWIPPTLYTRVGGEHNERKVTWLELFYDLVYVATLIQLGDLLSENVTRAGFLQFTLLFIPMWWSWTGITFWNNRFVADDVWHRVLIFVQIFFIAVLGISVRGATGVLGVQFTLAYVGIRLVLVALYFRASRSSPEARDFARRYAIGFFVAAMVWLSAVFVSPEYRPWVWLLGMAVDFAVPLSKRSRELSRALPIDVPHLAERYGIFTIIVLGESFVKVISGLGGTQLSGSLLPVGLSILVVSASLWWLYFDDVAGSLVKPSGASAYAWIYSHLPIAIGLTAFGVGAKKVLLAEPAEHLHSEYRWLVVASLVLYLLFVAILDEVTVRSDQAWANRPRGVLRAAGASALLLVGWLGEELTPILFMALVAVIFLVEVVTEVLYVRSRLSSREALAEH
jgi:low temperature requirement protein LtrA